MERMNTMTALAMAAPGQGGLNLLADLAVILCVAALTTVVFQRIRQPVVLGYLLAGMIVGPHLPIPLFASEDVAHTLSELGVILLMFSLGLEFSLRRLRSVAATAGIVAVIQSSLMLLFGHLVSQLFGWTTQERWFAGAIVAISSTTIIVKAFAEQGISGKVAELVFGILIVEDLIGILLLAILTTVGSGTELSARTLLMTAGRLAAFVAVLLVVGMLFLPRLMRAIVRLGRNETIVVTAVGLSFGFALLARAFGYSVALGAFLGGAIVAESGESKTIEKLIEPVRDVFAAVFFVSVGMLIEPAVIVQHALPVIVLTVVVVLGKLVGVGLGSFIAGLGVRTSIQAGMSLAQIGEFSFIIAALGLSLGATRHFLYPVAVAVSALTTLLTPWLIRVSDGFAAYVDRRLPPALQTYAALYGSWVEGLRSPGHATLGSHIRRLVGQLYLDLGLIAGITICVAVAAHPIVTFMQYLTGQEPALLRRLLIGATALLLVPFFLGAIRLSRALAATFAAEAFPSVANQLDLAAAPRRALVVTLQIGILLAAGGPLVVLVQPFYPTIPGLGILLVAVLALVYPLWRSATSLHGHARAGAEMIVDALAALNQPASETAAETAAETASAPASSLPLRLPPLTLPAAVCTLVPGLGRLCLLRLAPGSAAVGRSLREIGLRGKTGATVRAVRRPAPDGKPETRLIHPKAEDVLQAADVLVLTGSDESVAAAEQMLHMGATIAP